MTRKRTIGVLTTAFVVVAALIAVACGNNDGSPETSVTSESHGATASSFAGYVRSPATDVSGVVLPTVDGDEVTMVAAEGGLRLVFFGYTTCPDVCPATLGYIKIVLASLPESDRRRVEVDMITVDPARDDPVTLTRYLEQFVPGANAIRSEDDALLRSAADVFGASYEVSVDESGQPQVAHTGDLYAVDDLGRIVLAWPFGSAPADIEDDLRRLLDGERPDPRQ